MVRVSRRLTVAAALASCAVLSAACSIPLGAAMPQSATTLGHGNVGGALKMQWPDINPTSYALPDGSGSGLVLGTGQAPMSLEMSYGLTDFLDVEASLDGAFVYILPLPMGVSAGARVQVVEQ